MIAPSWRRQLQSNLTDMRLKWLKYLLLCGALLAGGASQAVHAAQWEQLKADRSDARVVARDSDIEVKTARLTIVVNVPRATNVKIYTILGQLISSETVPAGISQLRISSHGVYIVKIGGLTCKVAL